MKNKSNLSLIISVIALGISLFILFRPKEKEALAPPKTDPASGVRIAYINADTIMNNYLYVKELMNVLAEKSTTMEQDLQKKQKQYETDATYFQEQVQKGALSDASAREIYEKLMLKEQELYQLRDKYGQEIAQLEAEMNKKLLDKVADFLKDNNNFTYDYILNYTYNGDILLTNPEYDITRFVLDGLNTLHQKEKQ